MLTEKGGPEVVKCVDLPIVSPGRGQLRVRVTAAGVGSTDLLMLAGNYPYAPPVPFVPGYEIAGVVDAVGEGVDGLGIGQRVAALTLYGSYGELLVREAEHFLPIPDGVSVVCESLRRRAKARPARHVLWDNAPLAQGSEVAARGPAENLRTHR
jgi:NADPH2:quinone reductase